MPSLAEKAGVGPHRPWRLPLYDAGGVVAVTALSAWVFGHVEMSERVFAATRPWEFLELDEIPAVLLVLAVCLIWYAGRRVRETSAELARRTDAERKLKELLEDNRRLAQQHIEALESERKRLARELHDEAGQYLNAIKTDAVSIMSSGGDSPSGLPRAAAAIVEHTDRVYGVVRDLIRRLRPVGLDELGLLAALEHYIDHWRERNPQTRVSLSADGDLEKLDELRSLTCYRLVQEALTNVARHALATHVGIQLTYQFNAGGVAEVAIRIRDDGQGADLGARHAGLGLVGMRERIDMLGGTLRLQSAPSRGFEILAHIPLSGTETSAG
jgi:two-component system, NarL family, sensor histidine kinase UhpB